jgi:hypothetical protein
MADFDSGSCECRLWCGARSVYGGIVCFRSNPREPVGGRSEYDGLERKERMMSNGCRVIGLERMMLIAGLVGLAGLSHPAMGQNALGDGKALEANPMQGSDGRNYQRPSLEREVQFRNAIATGNAPGGLSFRGDLGYSAAGEFRGELGSDSLYAFRRDSLYSGLAGMGIRGTDAIQYQFSMTTGSRITRGLTGNLSVSRLGGSSSASLTGGIGDTGAPIAVNSEDALARAQSRVMGTLRSTSSYSSTSGLVPELLTTFEHGIQKDAYGLVASPLMGLVSTPMETGTRRRPGDGAPLEPTKTSYEQTIEQIRERAEELRAMREQAERPDGVGSGQDPSVSNQETDNWIQDRLQKLQRQVLGLPEPKSEDDPIEIVQPDDTSLGGVNSNGVTMRDPENPRADEEGRRGPLDGVEFGRGEDAAPGSTYTIDPETLELIRGDGGRVNYLVDPTAGDRDFYAEHMNAGLRLMSNHRYFDAEERFTNALSIRVGDVSAQLGRLHAQIGAGLVMSGSVNLQTLMSEHLEVVSARYSGDLFPDEDRLNELINTLRERAGLVERESYKMPEPAKVKVACGLLIGYLGFQMDDAEQMKEGFDVVRRHGSGADLRLVVLLETVWGAVMEEQAVDQGESEMSP